MTIVNREQDKFNSILFFCTAVHRSVQACRAGADNKVFLAKQHFPSPIRTGSAVSAWIGNGIGRDRFRMLMHRSVHGMQGPLGKADATAFTQTRMSPERPYEFPGHRS